MRGDEFFKEIATRPPFTKLHPQVAAFLKDYLGGEKVIRFGDRFVVNTQFPPYPSPAFDRLAENFGLIGEAVSGRLYSVTLAVTNRCSFACWHCYNAGRSQKDLPLEILRRLASSLQKMGSVMVTLTGGEPLLRNDLEEIAGCFDSRTCLIVGTTGDGLTPARATQLASAGVFGVGISLDSQDEAEHDRMRGKQGAFRIALAALNNARSAGLYPYVVSVATRQFLEPERFFSFLRFAREHDAFEVHLLEPSLTGNLSGRTDVALPASSRRTIIDYQKQVAQDESLPIMSSFTYLEAPNTFGCGAGLTHLYIDGSGEVCPCNLVPLSFGNIAGEPLQPILDRMRQHFRQPRTTCVGRILAPHIPAGRIPTPSEVSEEICLRCLPRRHSVPLFFDVRSNAAGDVGNKEVCAAYDGVHSHYDEFWLAEAAQPIHALVDAIDWRGRERVFEAGCGTGYATALLARRASVVVGVDISKGMQEEAGRRLNEEGITNARLILADALAALKDEAPFDIIFSSWVLGYIPLAPFFAAASDALAPDGQVAVIVHRENSPKVPLEIFGELVARDPSVLRKRVAFDFPRGTDHLKAEMAAAGLTLAEMHEGTIIFRYKTAADVLEHLLKSGAGTAFYEAIDPARRDALTQEFLIRLTDRQAGRIPYEVAHDYIACIARKSGRHP
jgi:MoaA/NifB/PqqE/SkfB family radical SAM enzyme/protein-L-isoaspartate O-methyltransferase